MKKIIVVLLLILSPSIVFSKNVNFDLKMIPNSEIETKIINETESVFDVIAEKKVLDELKKDGKKFPTIIRQVSEVNNIDKSFSKNEDGSIDIERKMISSKVYYIVNENKVEAKESPMDILVGAVFYIKQSKDGSVELLKIKSEKIPDSQKEAFFNIISNMQTPLKDKSFNIGDEFIDETPLNLPIDNTVLNLTQKSKYTLKSINGDKAYFDVIISFDANINESQTNLNIDLNGYGIGELVYDMKSHLDIVNSVTMNINTKFNIKNMIVSTKMTMKLNVEKKLVK
ncbi:MAG: hypothetical protein C0625_11605 [Arcobacter sp.]|nr:MAG: hypothetical protein C0625_11605 [Arcobacter sp.]